MITSQDIINKNFEKSKMFGYRPDEVDDFLDSVVKTIQELENEKRELQHKIEVLTEKLEEYREDEASLRSALVGAQKLGDSMVKEAHQKADSILKEANFQAEQIVYNARRREESQREGLEQIKAEVSDFKSKLINIYRQHIELIRELPVEEAEEVPAAAPAAEPTPEVEAPAPAPVEEPAAAEPAEVVEEAAPAEEAAEDQPSTGFKISFDRFEKEAEEEEPAEVEERPVSRFEKSSDYSLGKESKYGQLKFGAGYELSRDERKRKR